jgi:hypothetical protein
MPFIIRAGPYPLAEQGRSDEVAGIDRYHRGSLAGFTARQTIHVNDGSYTPLEAQGLFERGEKSDEAAH